MKLLWCVVLFTVCAAVSAQNDFDGSFPDYWANDFDSSYDDFYNEEDANEDKNLEKPIETGDVSKQEIDEPQNGEEKKVDILEDYQIEDNRSNEKQGAVDNAGENEDVLVEAKDNEEDLAVIPLEDVQQAGAPKENAVDDSANWGDEAAEDIAPLPVPSAEDNKDILEETRNILNEDSGNFEDPQDEGAVNEEVDPIDEQAQSLIDETNRLLQEDDDAFEADDYENSDEQDEDKSEEDMFNGDNEDEDSPQKIYADLNADLDKLFETLDKLTDDKSDEDDVDDDDEQYDNVQEYEEKYQKPYKEDVVLALRENEAEGAKRNLLNEFSNEQQSAEADENLDENEDSDDYEVIDDSNLSDIFAAFANQTDNEQQDLNNEDHQEPAEPVEQAAEDNVEEGDQAETSKTSTTENAQEIFDYIDNFGEPVDPEPSADEDIDSVIRQVFSDDIKEPQSYGNDALVDDTQPKNDDAEEIDAAEASTTQANEAPTTENTDDLSSAELSDLMTKFVAEHSEDLDMKSENFEKHVAPIRITLSPDEPVVVTSPNWPNNYPSNNIVDWIFEGPGTGIEMNITEFNINGGRGDYLLIKPGGLDESGNDGLIFSYQLHSERKYRFVGVDRMFARFESKGGWALLKGFRLTVKLIWPLPPTAEEVDPVPQPIIMPPNQTLVLNLAGVSMPQFHEVHEEFKKLVADMAEEYIRDNDIDPGLNTTLEVTQITRTAVCNIHWPNYETCVEVVFGVPLQYEGDEEAEPRLTAEDLDTMWTTYIAQEKYSSRLRALGITEYAIPNDRTVLMVWLVIASGVVLSMAMLAFALWRFSCFEDYTRMRAFSDTDSLKNEKRTLDLYPTPHQTLPPLYTENDYKWADHKYDDSTRVDLGGFSNKSYVRDDLFDLDSDEDAITTRDRYTTNV
ncbi:aspartic and glutamic acid-rich protein-like isoform X2 [Trichoplusia ni]|uniref:Aspartic and glutamic acid-rich protein-like isoform X2 n=1 Tax=Trichoplusia ni TaxID=7111 RepID=A0A7E5W5Q5_TRINI|nr:aspartic and glutamic acid-rich protein-like isoform X2 [Trichoplusia ni]